MQNTFMHPLRVVGLLLLTLLNIDVLAKPWKGAEIISTQTFKYGAFEARIFAGKGGGVITPFFLWKDGSEIPGSEWQEMDFEIFGRDGSFQTQAMTPAETLGTVRTEHVMMHYPTNPAYKRYNTYRMEWTPDSICYYYNGIRIRKETDRNEFSKLLDPARAEPMQLRLSVWAGDGSWSGAFDSTSIPTSIFVNWVQVYSYTPGTGTNGSNYTLLWREDFQSLDSRRWWFANWTFEAAVNDYLPANALVQDGYLQLALTHWSRVGTFSSTPIDDGLQPPLLEALPVDSTPNSLPGGINLQNFITSFDKSIGNAGSRHCPSTSLDVDFQKDPSDTNTCYLSNTDAGEWLEYLIDSKGGTYEIKISAATPYQNRKLQVFIDSIQIGSGIQSIASDWTGWRDYSIRKVQISSGVHLLRIFHETGALNVRKISIEEWDPSISIPGVLRADAYDEYFDLTQGNVGGACQNDDVDKQLIGGIAGDCGIGWTQPGEWIEYSANVEASGWYEFVAKTASPYRGQTLQIHVNNNLVATLTAPQTSWTSYADAVSPRTFLSKGLQRIKITFPVGGVNLHLVEVNHLANLPPDQVVNLQANSGNGYVDLAWSTSFSATSYTLLRNSDSIATILNNSYRDSGLTNGVQYSYSIIAQNEYGAAPPSNPVSATPVAPEPPAAPTGLAALAGNALVSLVWSPVDAATGYKVHRSTNGTDFTALATVVDAQYSDISVTNGTVYSYRVTALRGTLESAPSAVVDAAPRGVAPVQVTGLVATPADAKVTLTWTAPAGAETYTIYRGVDGAAAVVLTVVSSATYEDLAVANGASYTYSIVASNAWGDAPISAEATAIPLAYPDVPQSLVATPGNARVDLAWVGGANTESFKVYRRLGAGANELLATVATPVYADLAVVNGTTYTYSVTAVNATLESAPSAPATARPVGALPEQVVGLAANAGDALVALTWSAATGATSYKVMRSTGAGAGVLVGTSSTTSFVDATVVNGTTYSYWVLAANEWGDAPASVAVTSLPDFAQPGAPSGLTALAGNARVTLAWTAGSNNASFKIYRSVDAGAAILLATTTLASYVDATAVNGTTYLYTVAGVNGTKESAVSNAAVAAPRGDAPSQVTGLVATAGNATVALSWSASPLATVYKVVRGLDTVARIASTSYTDNAVVNGTTYTYAVVASNVWGDAPVSASVSAKPSAPTAALKAQYKAGTVGATTNGIRPLMQLVNTGSAPVALSKVTVRYWFTNNGSQSVNYWCDWAQIGNSNLTGTVKTVSPARTKADRYLEIAFKTSAGNLAAGASTGEIQSRFSKSDWTNFTQTDDASYDATKASAYADWNKVTVYYEGALVWGEEP